MRGGMTARAVLALCAAAASMAVSAQAPEPEADVEEIVVTGRRSGVPLWRVTGPTTSIVLVGSIEGVSKTTKWDPEPLLEALVKADRVMFPESHVFTASPFSAIGWLAKWKGMSSLPKEQKLADFVEGDMLARLSVLRERGLAMKDFERRHPLHLALDLRDDAKGKIDYGRSVAEYVARAARKHKLEVVPIARSKAKPLVKDLFASSPAEHVPCLADAVTLAEAGPEAVQARSDAWAARRVTEALSSPAQAVYASCWPATERETILEDIDTTLRELLAEPRVTLAVFSLATLAQPGGALDRLEAAGFEIEGPAWKE